MSTRLLIGDCREVLGTLPEQSVQCCVTSPPYYGLRDYGCVGQIGLEPTPDEYVAQMVGVFRCVWRVLRDDGTVWLNIGDSYAVGGAKSLGRNDGGRDFTGGGGNTLGSGNPGKQGSKRLDYGAKPKDLLGIPWTLAFALRADGWYLRSAIVWHKPNPMPESVTDRPTSAHEMVFLLSKRAAYYYDADAIAEESISTHGSGNGYARSESLSVGGRGQDKQWTKSDNPTRNARNVWTIASQPYSGSHFATMPPALADRCIKAGSKPGDTVLDPFGGAGTTGLVADRLGRNAVLIELNPEYAGMAKHRVSDDAGLFGDVAVCG